MNEHIPPIVVEESDREVILKEARDTIKELRKTEKSRKTGQVVSAVNKQDVKERIDLIQENMQEKQRRASGLVYEDFEIK